MENKQERLGKLELIIQGITIAISFFKTINDKKED